MSSVVAVWLFFGFRLVVLLLCSLVVAWSVAWSSLVSAWFFLGVASVFCGSCLVLAWSSLVFVLLFLRFGFCFDDVARGGLVFKV